MDKYYSVKMIFVPKYVSRMVFKGGILGGARQFWGNPYLNSTTVLFDIEHLMYLAPCIDARIFTSKGNDQHSLILNVIRLL